jgi:uncharacterized membrane protein
MNSTSLQQDQRDLAKEKRITTIVYALQAASFLVGITYIAAAVLNYAKWSEVEGTWLESHFRWQTKTFWYSVLWGIVGGLTTFLLVGYLVLFANAVWIIYRIVVGWVALSEERAITA